MNSTHDITYAQFDEKYIFGEGTEPGGIQFHQLHDLNKDPSLPFADDGQYDAVLCCTGVQYLQEPEQVFAGAPWWATASNVSAGTVNFTVAPTVPTAALLGGRNAKQTPAHAPTSATARSPCVIGLLAR